MNIDFDKNASEDKIDTTRKSGRSEYVLADESLVQSEYKLETFNFEEDSTLNSNSVKNFIDYIKNDSSKLKLKLGLILPSDKDSVKHGIDTLQGLNLIKQAAESGSPEAMMLLGKAYELGAFFQKDTVTAYSEYLHAYKLGALRAGKLLYGKANSQRFFDMLKKEIDKGNPEAMYVWAGMAALGFNFQITKEQAFKILEKAAKLNHIPSMVELGNAYFAGSQVTKDTAKAYQYWRKAAELGSVEATIKINFNKLTNASLPRSEKANSVKQLKVFANRGSVLAQALLGLCYEQGIGVKMDKAKAAEFYRMAAQRGSQSAYFSLKSMYDKIRPKNRPEFKIFESEL